jgi:hypothetical protein
MFRVFLFTVLVDGSPVSANIEYVTSAIYGKIFKSNDWGKDRFQFDALLFVHSSKLILFGV